MPQQPSRGPVVVIGGANVDVKVTCAAAVRMGTSNPGHSVMTAGGVGRNVAENVARLGTPVELICAIGDDVLAPWLVAACEAAGMGVGAMRRVHDRTGTYTAVLDHDGELVVAVADMAATAALSPSVVAATGLIERAAWLVLDANLRPDTLSAALDGAAAAGVPVLVNPVSQPKCEVLAGLLSPSRPVAVVTPNRGELAVLTGTAIDTRDALVAAARSLLSRGVGAVWVRMGPEGSVWCGPEGDPVWFEPLVGDVVDVTGAGDSMDGAFVHARWWGASDIEAVQFAHGAAALTVASEFTVRPDLRSALVAERAGVPDPKES